MVVVENEQQLAKFVKVCLDYCLNVADRSGDLGGCQVGCLDGLLVYFCFCCLVDLLAHLLLFWCVFFTTTKAMQYFLW